MYTVSSLFIFYKSDKITWSCRITKRNQLRLGANTGTTLPQLVALPYVLDLLVLQCPHDEVRPVLLLIVILLLTALEGCSKK